MARALQSSEPFRPAITAGALNKDTNHMAKAKTFRDALIDEVRDLYHAEKQLVRALPKLAKNASNDALREALTSHLEETKGHVSILEQVFEALDEPVKAKACAGMAGIVEEGADILEENVVSDAVLDAMIIAAAQRAEHYEIAAYGTAAQWAKTLGLTKVSKLLGQILGEEEAADKKLTELAEGSINQGAAAAVSET